jgi:hypothetical protein
MILFLLIILFVFIYPFVNRNVALVFTGVLMIAAAAAFIFLFDAEQAMLFSAYAGGAFAAGSLFRYFYQRSKYNSEAEDLINQYNTENKDEDPV